MTVRSTGVWPAGLAATNRIAANVKKRGFHFESNVKPNKGLVRSDVPIPVKEWDGKSEHDWTGRRVGRFTVVGAAKAIKHTVRGAAWVVRCDCSMYEIRRTRALKSLLSGEPEQACCHDCYRAWVLRKRDRRRALGLSTKEEEAIARARAARRGGGRSRSAP